MELVSRWAVDALLVFLVLLSPAASSTRCQHLSGQNYTSCYCATNPCLLQCCTQNISQKKECSDREVLMDPGSLAFRTSPGATPGGGPHPKLVLGLPDCPEGMYLLEPWLLSQDEFVLLTNGSMFRPFMKEWFNFSQFCVQKTQEGKLAAGVCFVEDENDTNHDERVIFTVYPVGMIVSLPFLLATFLVYLLVSELRNLHGKTVMSYILSLILGYFTLAMIQLTTNVVPAPVCILGAFTIQFSFLATFFWLNVMCFDIWWTFSGLRKLGGSAKETERKKFIAYSVYAWGAPVLVLGVTLLMEYTPVIPVTSVFKPMVGNISCFFATREATWLYFYGPMGLLLLTNVVMFVTTARKILLHTKETAVLNSRDSQRHDNKDKERFYLYLKLFLVMGINWATELISWIAGGPEEVWYITDITNTLQGVFIFVIFVCKKRVVRLLAAKLCPSRRLFQGRKSATATNSQRTASTGAEDSIRLNTVETSKKNGQVKATNELDPIIMSPQGGRETPLNTASP